MNTKSTGLLLAAAALLFAFIFLVERPLRIKAAIPANHKVFPGLDPAKVDAVEVHFPGAGRVIRAERSNHVWQLTKPDSYPASSPMLEQFLQGLAQWEWQSSIDRPGSWEEYGLVQDQLTVLLQENGAARALKIGRFSPVGGNVYVNTRGSDLILVADSAVIATFPTNEFLWRDLTVLNLDGVDFQKLQARSPNWSFDLERDTNSGLWTMTKPVEARADTPRINQWLAELRAMRVRRFVPEEAAAPGPALASAAAPPAPQLVLTFLRDTNIVFELQVDEPSVARTNLLTNQPPALPANLALARRYQLPGLIEIEKAPLLPWEGDYTNFLDRHLIGVATGLIGSMEVSGRGIETFTVQKTDGGSWRVTSAAGETFLADTMLMADWLASLTNIQIEIGRSVVEDKSPFGLDKPANALLRFRIFYDQPGAQTNPPLADLLFGQGTNQPARIYEMGNDRKYVNSIEPGPFSRLPNAFWQLRDRAIWRFESNDVTAIEIHQLGGRLRLTRDEHNQWTLPPGVVVNIVQPAIEETLYRLGQLRAIYWSGYGEEHLERFGFAETDYEISLELNKDGRMETNTVQFGKPSPIYTHPYASVMRDGRRLVFEFPVDLYSNLVSRYLVVPPAYRQRR